MLNETFLCDFQTPWNTYKIQDKSWAIYPSTFTLLYLLNICFFGVFVSIVGVTNAEWFL